MKNIAILLATYNGGQYLREQLDSLFAQTNQDFRIVIHDDGSTDNTVEIINEYKEKYPERIEVLDGKPKGTPKANFMYLLSEVEADCYFFCDQDDVWLPTKVEESLKAFKNLIYINTNDVDEEMFSSTNIINKLSSRKSNINFTFFSISKIV